MSNTKIGAYVVSGVIGLFVLIVILSSFGTVGAGDRGIRTHFGQAVGIVDPGLYWKTPSVEHVVDMDVQTQKVSQDASAASADLQDVKTTVAVNYNIDPNKVLNLYKTVGLDYADVIIDPAIQETIKAATARYTAEQLVTKREVVRAEVVEALTDKLATQGIIVTQVSITNFAFSDSFNSAIEAKVTAEQNALAAKNKLEQVQYEKQQRIAQAEGEAEAIKIQAQAVNSQGGADYVALQAIKQWDGHLPTQMIPGSSVPFINVNK